MFLSSRRIAFRDSKVWLHNDSPQTHSDSPPVQIDLLPPHNDRQSLQNNPDPDTKKAATKTAVTEIRRYLTPSSTHAQDPAAAIVTLAHSLGSR